MSAHGNQIPLVDLKAQYLALKPEIDAAMAGVIDRTSFILGPEVEAFETSFGAFCGGVQAIGVANGTDATGMALRAVGVGAGDEVITVSHTFIATVEGISELGAKPVFVDVQDGTLLMDASKVEAAITSRTKAILPVHLYGQTVDMDPLLALAEKHDLKIVEDACQAHGAEYKGRRAGSMGDAATFSFYPGKNLGAYGDAGAITTRHAEVADWLKSLRNHGRATKYTHDFEGRNSRMDGLQGAVLNVKLPHLDRWNAKRRDVAARYDAALMGLPNLRRVATGLGCTPVFHLYVVRVPNRDQVLATLKAEGIEAGIHYPVPLHLQKACAHLEIPSGTLPVTERVASEILSLPIFPELNEKDQDRIIEVVRKALAGSHA
ncbi:DegT/DnrJ/EryC1/StrS family aminotransferase [Geothrix sp.]|jgi:dTDP-4-amino-4,6-dideoxygalactose transaminase|uniref:DegT/DnrJ/EryC1/StrS family aminotransferase n=1 Tax=Geothrix sp. TaxID=1962974 RepID=UPI0025B8D8A2|nr:DegT/DnrJ/EryC1/StrS family aminotransferase [Geothrix sp.]